MGELRHFGRTIVRAAPYLLLTVAAYFGSQFVPEALGRIYLWICVYHFAPYANHADIVGELFDAGKWATISAIVPFAVTCRTPRRARVVSLCYFGGVGLTFILYLIMVKTHGLVSYEEFVAHGV